MSTHVHRLFVALAVLVVALVGGSAWAAGGQATRPSPGPTTATVARGTSAVALAASSVPTASRSRAAVPGTLRLVPATGPGVATHAGGPQRSLVLAPRAHDASAPGEPIAGRQRAAYLKIMLEGSLNVSRTKVDARRFMASDSVKDADVSKIAEKNFRVAAKFVLDHPDAPLNLDTAITLNRILTKGLVPEDVRGLPIYREDPSPFYEWLGSRAAQDSARTDPVGFAEELHHSISKLDAFPDGNGRTARLMADLALLRSGHAPAFYTDMKDYFARGNSRASNDRAGKIAYFREIVARADAQAAGTVIGIDDASIASAKATPARSAAAGAAASP